MKECTQFYIDGQWTDALGPRRIEALDPASETPCALVALGDEGDIEAAVAAARAAFPTWSTSPIEQRLQVLQGIAAGIKNRGKELAGAVSSEMGAPMRTAMTAHLPSGMAHFSAAAAILQQYAFEEQRGNTLVLKEPIGVCGLITPWNWPLNQIACKVAPAIAAGCTVVLKPSEAAPLSAALLAEIIADAGLPPGVFNLVGGDGHTGELLTAHPEIDLVSFTGSTRAGRAVGRAAAAGIKRVTLELGGKSANIVLESADFARAVRGGVDGCWDNSGQSCNAPARLLVPAARQEEAIEIARTLAEKTVVGAPHERGTRLGPVANRKQFDKVQALIARGLEEGARLIVGGPGRPPGLEHGFYVRPTVFADVDNGMDIARQEIFGPVLVILPYRDEDEAVRIANDSEYGLSGYVSGEAEHARAVARRLRSGMVHLNGARLDFAAPFGGYKQSGNGREWGVEGFEEFLETKSVFGYGTA